jgi:starch synthase
MRSLRVLAVASEIYPIVKTGGLADVVGALPIELRACGIETRTLVPGYPEVIKALPLAVELLNVPNFFGGPVRLLAGSHGGLDLMIFDAPHLFARPGNPYVSADGKDWPDNGLRFAALCRVAAEIGLGAVSSFVPDVVHCHDWQAGLVPAYLRYAHGQGPASIMTIHNLAYPGQFPKDMLEAFGLPPESFTIDGVEYYGTISFLKAGLQYADRITTVSPTYAQEILDDAGGMGFAGLLRARSDILTGILNGIDSEVWNPETDRYIASCFSSRDIQPRKANKSALQRQFGLKQEPGRLLLGIVSRLTWQKGLDLVLENLTTIVDQGMQLVVLGSGDSNLQDRLQEGAKRYPGLIGVKIGYDEALAHLIQAGADATLVPSRFEPCGLTQLCALRYGSVPIVSRVGGLADTVDDSETVGQSQGGATGFTFSPLTGDAFNSALRKANAVWRNKQAWQRLQVAGMSKDVSWRGRAEQYADLYKSVTGHRTIS